MHSISALSTLMTMFSWITFFQVVASSPFKKWILYINFTVLIQNCCRLENLVPNVKWITKFYKCENNIAPSTPANFLALLILLRFRKIFIFLSFLLNFLELMVKLFRRNRRRKPQDGSQHNNNKESDNNSRSFRESINLI